MLETEVLPSQGQGKKTELYKTWVIVNKTNNCILTANCTCMAGYVHENCVFLSFSSLSISEWMLTHSAESWLYLCFRSSWRTFGAGASEIEIRLYLTFKRCTVTCFSLAFHYLINIQTACAQQNNVKLHTQHSSAVLNNI